MNKKRRRRRKVFSVASIRRPQPRQTDEQYAISSEMVQKLREAARVYQSQGRALQVGSELLIRMRKPLRPVKRSRLARMTYKVIGRAIELIDRM